MNNSNGFRVAFWVMTVIATVGMVMLTNFMVENDRLRQEGDKTLLEKFVELREISNDSLHKIDLRLSRIEQKLEIK